MTAPNPPEQTVTFQISKHPRLPIFEASSRLRSRYVYYVTKEGDMMVDGRESQFKWATAEAARQGGVLKVHQDRVAHRLEGSRYEKMRQLLEPEADYMEEKTYELLKGLQEKERHLAHELRKLEGSGAARLYKLRHILKRTLVDALGERERVSTKPQSLLHVVDTIDAVFDDDGFDSENSSDIAISNHDANRGGAARADEDAKR